MANTLNKDMLGDGVAAYSHEQTDKIVIVGAACRFPGADSLAQYWNNLLQGKDCLSTTDRWREDGVTPPCGGFLSDISSFDAPFFRISPNEARCIDPQQRVLMEIVHHCIEDSSLPVSTLRKMKCGVFCTSLPGDYKFLLAANQDLAFSTQSFLGNAPSSLSGRISYYYDFNGPSITLDTACSSALTAVQLAYLNLQEGSCDAAIIGAASIFSTMEVFKFAKRANMLSTAGRCAAFSEMADGFVPSEGAAAILLMRASSAASLGLSVSGIIEAIGINHDGQSNGLMAPNSRAQTDLITSTYRRFNIAVEKIGYVEAHGTGTSLGDPIETIGLVNAYRSQWPGYSCFLGASKAIIGHTLVCSALASIIKVLLILRHKTIPPHPVPGPINTKMELDGFVLNSAAVPWPVEKELCAVSAFGFTGTNGHLVLRGPTRMWVQPAEPQSSYPFLFSAETVASLRANLAHYLSFLEDLPEEQLGALSMSQGRMRQWYRKRVAVVASTRSQLRASISRMLEQPNGITQSSVSVSLPAQDMELKLNRWLAGENMPLYDSQAVANALPIELPLYQFERKTYWVETAPAHSQVKTAAGTSSDQDIILRQLQERLAGILGFAADEIDTSRPLRDLGIDSISAIELLSKFGNAASVITPQDLFNYPSIDSLARDLSQRLSAIQSLPTNSIRVNGSSVASLTVSSSLDNLIRWEHLADSGKPILLLPPLNTSSRAWIQQISFLKKNGYRPVVPIYPGHLDNRLKHDRLNYDDLVGEMIDYMNGTLDGHGMPVLGWSLGGCLALGIAIRAPHLVSSLILISTAARFDDNIFGKTLDLQADLEAHSDYLDVVFNSNKTASEQLSAGATMEVLSQYYGMLAQFDVVHALRNIFAPALIVHGKKDVVVGADDIRALSLLPQSARKDFHDQGHFIPLTAARSFNQTMLKFVAK